MEATQNIGELLRHNIWIVGEDLPHFHYRSSKVTHAAKQFQRSFDMRFCKTPIPLHLVNEA